MPRHLRATRAITILSSVVLGLTALVAAPRTAHADPSTPVVYPSASSETRLEGRFFDTCTAPSLTALAAWRGTSPYKGVNIYFGGRNRGCTQPNLTTGWVRDASAAGWALVPTYFGDQPFCTNSTKPFRYSASGAAARGAADGNDAVARAKGLGIRAGSALYADVEHYDRSTASCRAAVRTYVSEWTRALHRNGFLAGVYVHQDSGLRDLSATYLSTAFARPDAVWMARWDLNPSLTGWPTAPNSQWSEWQRMKQYRGDHNETWGGVTLNIDSDNAKAPVATVAKTYRVTSSTPLNMRREPTSSSALVGTKQPGSTLAVICQARGQKVGTSPIWDRLTNGAYVADYFVSTPSQTGFSPGLPRCTYPGQVMSTVPITTRAGPGTSYAAKGSLQPGALAHVVCQRTGSLVGSTRVWDLLPDARWVSDHYVSNRSNTTFSAPVPRCP